MTSEAVLPQREQGDASFARQARPAGQVLLLSPSRGLGGGIERYVQAVESAFDDAGVASRRLDLARPGPAGHRMLLAEATAALVGAPATARLVIAHRALLPVATVLASTRPVGGISVICHGSDVWGTRWGFRSRLESLLMRRRDVRIVAVSGFTAGALFPGAQATILPPGLSRTWFSELVSAADQARTTASPAPPAGLELMTAFRLDEWRDKGLPQLTAAIRALGRSGITLTVCGSGEPPADLLAHVRDNPWCTIRPGLTDTELAAQFARSSLFVLATRTRPGRRPCGEGFGLVLLEAQVTGTPVVGPAHGGSPDAYLNDVTGATPRDESVASLTRVLDELTRHPAQLDEMGTRAAAWARARFAPDRYAALAIDRLLLVTCASDLGVFQVTVIDRRRPATVPTTSADASPRLAAGLSMLAAAAALVAVALSTALPSGEIVWGSIALTVFSLGLLLLMSAVVGYDGLGLASWRIGPWSLVWGAFAFGLATISWVSPQTGSAVEIWLGSILRALWMIGVALTMLTIGYCAGPYRLAAARAGRATDALSRRFTDEIRGPIVPWVLFGAGIAAQLGFSVLTGRFGYVGDVAASVKTASGYSQYLAVAGECVPLAVVAATIRAYQVRTTGSWLTLSILFAAAIAVGAVAGGKTSFVVAILAVIIPRTVARRGFPAGAIVAAIGFFLLIVIPFNHAYRAAARGQVTLSTSQAVAAAPAIASQVAASDLSAAELGQSADYLAQRIRTIDTPAIIMQRTPSEIGYGNPAQLLISPVVDLIPRILWPGKPILAPGYQVSQEYYDLPAQVYTSSNVTPEGDLYRHGGWFPLIFGMFVIGCGIRILDEVTDLRRSVHGAFLIILLFPGIVQAGSDCATLLAGIPGMVLLWLAVVALSFRRRPAQAP